MHFSASADIRQRSVTAWQPPAVRTQRAASRVLEVLKDSVPLKAVISVGKAAAGYGTDGVDFVEDPVGKTFLTSHLHPLAADKPS